MKNTLCSIALAGLLSLSPGVYSQNSNSILVKDEQKREVFNQAIHMLDSVEFFNSTYVKEMKLLRYKIVNKIPEDGTTGEFYLPRTVVVEIPDTLTSYHDKYFNFNPIKEVSFTATHEISHHFWFAHMSKTKATDFRNCAINLEKYVNWRRNNSQEETKKFRKIRQTGNKKSWIIPGTEPRGMEYEVLRQIFEMKPCYKKTYKNNFEEYFYGEEVFAFMAEKEVMIRLYAIGDGKDTLEAIPSQLREFFKGFLNERYFHSNPIVGAQ